MWPRIGWFLQQILKVYAGKVLGLQDFILMDSDVVWFKPIKFLSQDTSNVTINGRRVPAYYYTTSNQYHPAYFSTMRKIANLGLPDDKITKQPHRSGIAHHMVIIKEIMDKLFDEVEGLHGGLPMWKVFLNQRSFL